MRIASTPLSAEKRRAPRMPVDWSVQARVLGEEQGLGAARLTNISKGGIAVLLDRAVERDAVLKVSFSPGDGGQEVQAYATVAWCLGPDEPHAGLRFMGIGENDQERLAVMVEKWLITGGRPGSTRH